MKRPIACSSRASSGRACSRSGSAGSVILVLEVFLERFLKFLPLLPLVLGQPRLLLLADERPRSFLRAHGNRRRETFEILALASGARRRRIRGAHQRLEMMMAPAAFVFVERHICPIVLKTVTGNKCRYIQVMSIDLEHLRGWIGRAERSDDSVTAAPIAALSATLDRG